MRVFFIYLELDTPIWTIESILWHSMYQNVGTGLQRFDHHNFGTTSMSKLLDIGERDYDVTKKI